MTTATAQHTPLDIARATLRQAERQEAIATRAAAWARQEVARLEAIDRRSQPADTPRSST